jgi:hypothetical protein
MEKEGKSLEEISKEFLKLRIKIDPSNKGFNPVEIDNLHEHIDKINYLLGKEYLAEKDYYTSKETTVKSLRYIRTSEGNNWALS